MLVHGLRRASLDRMGRPMRSKPPRIPSALIALLALIGCRVRPARPILPRLTMPKTFCRLSLAESSKIYAGRWRPHHDPPRGAEPHDHPARADARASPARGHRDRGPALLRARRGRPAGRRSARSSRTPRSGEIREGGSTITQQYVKNVIISPGETAPKTIERKLNEAALARQLETKLSKDEILERYLNTVYFGEGAYGVEAAAKTYFGKPARKLTLAESATLAGIIRLPEQYDPYKNPEVSTERRNLVLAEDGRARLRRPSQGRRRRRRDQDQAPEGGREGRVSGPLLHRLRPASGHVPPKLQAARQDRCSSARRGCSRAAFEIYTTVDLDMQAAAERGRPRS